MVDDTRTTAVLATDGTTSPGVHNSEAERLTDRQCEVLQLLAEGKQMKGMKEIGGILQMTTGQLPITNTESWKYWGPETRSTWSSMQSGTTW